jgi:hypothetical protein
MNKSNSSPARLRIFLLVSVILMVAVLVGGFIYASIWLADSASKIKAKNYSNVSGSIDGKQMTDLQQDVNSNKSNSIKATSLIVPSKTYENIIHQDLSKYANEIGIPIGDYSLSQKPSFMTTDAPITGVQPQFVSVSISGPVQFNKLLEFIQAIESNVPKMKISGINISSVSGQNSMVSVKPIIIEVYTQ